MNKLLSKFDTQFQSYPFQEISIKDIEEAIRIGIEEEKKSIEQICRLEALPTFENTIIPFESSGETLTRATTLMYNLLSANRCDHLEMIAEQLTSVLTKHHNEIYQNKVLFSRIKSVKETSIFSSDEDKMLVEKIFDAFIDSGIALQEEERVKFNNIKAELAQLKLLFSKNLVNETKAFQLIVKDLACIDGLPDINLLQASEKAKEKGIDGWLFDLYAPSYIPFMTYVKDRSLRQEMYMAYNTRCNKGENTNVDICRRIINLSRELAQLLGYNSYADYVLKNRMAESVSRVKDFLSNLQDAYLPFAKEEVKTLADFASSYEGFSFDLQPWDFAYYAQKLKQQKYDFDPEEVRPYLELSNVIQGVFDLATTLYGITFKKNNFIQVYHKDVVAYEVYDSNGTFLALLYTDFFPRDNKQSGAWMTSYVEQKQGCRPHVSIVMNFTPPTAQEPSLLTLDEVETFLHEFGHALHGIFANTKYQSLSGTNVYWDFVELPSQIMENYLYEKDFLYKFARHYQTQEVLPESVLSKILASRNFNAAYACIRQLSFALLDMSYFALDKAFQGDLNQHERQVWKNIQLLPFLSGTCMTTQFSHIMDGGYAAGYYSYKWAEVLDADAFSLFKEVGVFSRQVATSFRKNILEKGGTIHPMTLYKEFRQSEPSLDALLKRNGLI